MTSLDILIPVFNPAPGWEDTAIQRFHSIQSKHREISFTLFLVNDGTAHLDTSPEVKKLRSDINNIKWISYGKNKGKGYALRQGVSQSSGDLLIYTDVDWPYSEESMTKVIEALQSGVDIAVGTRDEAYYKRLPVMRKYVSNWLKKINGWLLHLKVNDTQAGLKGFTKLVKPVFLSTTINRYLFDLEFIYLASRQNLSIGSVPIELRAGIAFSKMSRLVLIHEAWNFLRIWLKSK